MSALGRLYRGENDIAFPKWWKRGAILSTVLIVVSLVSLFTRGLNLGIDFEGGMAWEVKAPGASVSETRAALEPVGLGQAKIQVVGADTLRVQGPADTPEKQNEVRKVLADLAGTDIGEVNVSTVGPSWGNAITHAALRALIIFLVAILIYLTIRLEWQMAVAAIVAIIHDMIISVGVYSVFGIEVTPATVIAFLTILGYSIYDTVVVFDKAQENEGRVGLAGRLTYTDMMSLSMNQVLLRWVNTTVTSLIPVISLWVVGAVIMGAVTIEEFAIALTVGLAAGAYSSIFVAAPLVVVLKEREPKYKAIRERLAQTRGGDGTAATRGQARTKVAAPGSEQDAASDLEKGSDRGSGKGTTQPGLTPAGTIPPRPRKKSKKR